MEVLGRIAAALNVPLTVVELKIFEWKVRFYNTGYLPADGCTLDA